MEIWVTETNVQTGESNYRLANNAEIEALLAAGWTPGEEDTPQ